MRIVETRTLDDARAVVRRAEAELAKAQVMRDEAALRLERMQVRAPVAGVVMSRLVEPGSKLLMNMDNPRSAQAVRLYDPAHLQVRVDVPLADAAKVSVGQDAQVVVDVLPDRAFKGKVTRIVHEADIQKNTLQVKVAISEPSPQLKPEMLTRVKFLASAAVDDAAVDAVIFAPRLAIRRDAGGQTSAWVVDVANGVAVPRPIIVGDAQVEDWVEVRSGLQFGDKVVVSDVSSLSPGSRVAAHEADANLPYPSSHREHQP